MNKKEIKVECCEEFIKKQFEKLHFKNGGIEVNCFWRLAEKSGLWEKGTFGGPMSVALENLTTIEDIKNEKGKYAFSVFRLK